MSMKAFQFLPFLAYDTFSQQGPFIQEDIPKFIQNLESNKTSDSDFNGKNSIKDMTEFIESCKNDISNLLSEEKKIIQLVRLHHPQIINFICQNIESIINISLDNQEKNKAKSKTAFSILLSPDHDIHNALVNPNSCILEKMANLTHNKNDNRFSFRRILQLINLTIQVSQYWEKEFPQPLKFIINYIYEIDDPTVYNFFESICSDNDCYSSVQNWLSEINFHTIIFDELLKIKEKLCRINKNEKREEKDSNFENEKTEEKNKFEKDLQINPKENQEEKPEEEQNENSEAKQEEKPEEEQNENSETKQEENPKTEQNENLEAKQEENTETKQEENTETKQEENSEAKQNENSEAKQEEKEPKEEYISDKKENNVNAITDLQKAYNYLCIIGICLSSSRLYKNFISPTLVDIVKDEWRDISITDAFYDQLWVVISSILSKETTPLISDLIQRAIDLIKEPFQAVRLCRVCSVELITDIIIIDNSYIPLIASSHLEDEVLKLIRRFPGHTFLENSLFDLCLKSFEIPELQDQYINALLSPLISETSKDPETFADRILLGFSFAIFQKILVSSIFKGNPDFLIKIKEIKGFDEFENGFYKKRGRLLRIGYGGKIPIYRAKSTPSYSPLGI